MWVEIHILVSLSVCYSINFSERNLANKFFKIPSKSFVKILGIAEVIVSLKLRLASKSIRTNVLFPL